MIKRDTIQRVVLTPVNDGQGGTETSKDYKEVITVHCSQTATYSQMTQYGIKDQVVLNVVSNIKLDEYINSRYVYGSKMFKVVRQVKSGNEYFSVLLEVSE